jgi:hypothetical protein
VGQINETDRFNVKLRGVFIGLNVVTWPFDTVISKIFTIMSVPYTAGVYI